MSKTIFRVKKNPDNPYVMIDKRPIENRELSWKAKGILAYLLSRPDDWEIWILDLVNRSTDGESAVRAGLRELRKAGHLVYVGRERDAGQVKRAIWEIHEVARISPDSQNQHQVPPNSEKPNGDFPNGENRAYTNKDITNKDKTKEKLKIPLSIENQIFAGVGVVVPDDAALLKQAVVDSFGINVRWGSKAATKNNMSPVDFEAWMFTEKITVEQVQRAGKVWEGLKKYGWRTPTLYLIWENWKLLMKEKLPGEQQADGYEYNPIGGTLDR